MSFRNQKSLIVVGGVIAALLAGTVLLGGYAKFAPAKSDCAVESKTCGGCPMTQALLAKTAEAACEGQTSACSVESAMAEFKPEACPAGRTEPCCAEDPPKDCCGEPCPADCPKPCCEPCPPDCPKPCCAEQAEASGCCPVAAEAATQ
ncbi:MAG: hypothetical protein ACYTEK_16655 [Planctomycetota bacterium]